jgi:hypothetical protein
VANLPNFWFVKNMLVYNYLTLVTADKMCIAVKTSDGLGNELTTNVTVEFRRNFQTKSDSQKFLMNRTPFILQFLSFTGTSNGNWFVDVSSYRLSVRTVRNFKNTIFLE